MKKNNLSDKEKEKLAQKELERRASIEASEELANEFLYNSYYFILGATPIFPLKSFDKNNKRKRD